MQRCLFVVKHRKGQDTAIRRGCIVLTKTAHLPLILRNAAVGCTNIDGDLSEVDLREAKNGRRLG